MEGACGAKHLAEGVAGDEGDKEVRRRCREEKQTVKIRNKLQRCDRKFDLKCVNIFLLTVSCSAIFGQINTDFLLRRVNCLCQATFTCPMVF